MKIKTIVALASTLVLSNVYAEETYRVEAGAQYTTLSQDDQTKQSITGVLGAYYLKDIVIDHSQPFAEMDFLQRAGYVRAQTGNVSYEDSTFVKTNITPLSIGGQFYVGDFAFGLATSSWGPTNFVLKSNSARNYGMKDTQTGFSGGYFVLPTTLVSIVSNKETTTYAPTGVSALNDQNINTTSITSHTVNKLSGTQSLVLDLSYNTIKNQQNKTNNNSSYAANVRFYPVPRYYVEGGYVANSGDDPSRAGKTISFGAGYAFTERFGVMLSTAKFSVNDATQMTGNTTTMLTAGYRF